MSDIRKIKIGIVGVGYIGEIHISSYQAHPLCDVVAICDFDEERLGEMQQKYDVPRTYTDQAEMQANENLDGIVIATPDEYHRQPVELAAAAGLPIMLEKPIATTLEDAEAIIKAVEDANVTMMMGFTLRWIPQYVEIHNQVAAGKLGEITNAFARRSCRLSEARRLYGRCSVNQYLGVHDMDFLLWCMGRDVESIYSTKGDFILKPEIGVADYYWNVISWKNGATGVVHASWCEPTSYNNYVEMQVILNGMEAGAHMLLAGQQYSLATEGELMTPEVSLYATYPTEAAHFIDCVIKDETPIAGWQEGLDTLKLLLAAEESIATGHPVGVAL
jgi:predicted dehydrogenase